MSSFPTQRVLDALSSAGRRVRPAGNGRHMAQCPVHDDNNPSLSVAAGDDGRALLRCHAGCETETVVAALGLKMADLMPPGDLPGRSRASGNIATAERRPRRQRSSQPLADDAPTAGRLLAKKIDGDVAGLWLYENASGEHSFAVVRIETLKGKQYRPMHRRADGWHLGDPAGEGGKLPLYRLPQLAEAERVYITEGEKAADAAASIGLAATTSAHGANSPGKTDWQPLAGKQVVILPDNDTPGRGYARAVAAILGELDPASTVRIVELPDLPGHGDIADWLDQRDSVEADDLRQHVQALAEQASPLSPAAFSRQIKTVCLADVQPQPLTWLWPGRIPRGKLTMLAGDPGLGKSFVTYDIAARVSRGDGWPDGSPGTGKPGRVLLLSAEDDLADTIRPRLDAAGADVRRIHAIAGTVRPDAQGVDSFSLAADLQQLDQLLAHLPDAQLVIIDPITAYLGGIDSHKNAEVRTLLSPLSDLAGKRGVAFLAVNHLNKSAGSNAQYRMTGSLAFIAAARAGWMIVKDRDDPDRRLLLSAKNNLAREAPGMAYRLAETQSGTARVDWEPEPVSMTAAEALQDGDAGERSAVDEAADWLRQLLAEGTMPAADVIAQAKAEGFTESTVHRARRKARIETKRYGFGPGGGRYWRLPGP